MLKIINLFKFFISLINKIHTIIQTKGISAFFKHKILISRVAICLKIFHEIKFANINGIVRYGHFNKISYTSHYIGFFVRPKVM